MGERSRHYTFAEKENKLEAGPNKVQASTSGETQKMYKVSI